MRIRQTEKARQLEVPGKHGQGRKEKGKETLREAARNEEKKEGMEEKCDREGREERKEKRRRKEKQGEADERVEYFFLLILCVSFLERTV